MKTSLGWCFHPKKSTLQIVLYRRSFPFFIVFGINLSCSLVVFSEVLSSSTTRQASLGGGQVYGFLDQFGLFRYFGYVSNVQYPISNIFRVLTTQPTVPIRTITNTYEGGFVSEISRGTFSYRALVVAIFPPSFWGLEANDKREWMTLTWSVFVERGRFQRRMTFVTTKKKNFFDY